METVSTAIREDSSVVTGMRNLARVGQRDARAIGEDLTRQGRLRMDCSQVERRLKTAYASLGEIVCEDLDKLQTVDLNDSRIIELIAHIRNYQDELVRLQTVIRTSAGQY